MKKKRIGPFGGAVNSRAFEMQDRARRGSNSLRTLIGGLHSMIERDPEKALQEMKRRGYYKYVPEKEWSKAFALARAVNRQFAQEGLLENPMAKKHRKKRIHQARRVARTVRRKRPFVKRSKVFVNRSRPKRHRKRTVRRTRHVSRKCGYTVFRDGSKYVLCRISGSVMSRMGTYSMGALRKKAKALGLKMR